MFWIVWPQLLKPVSQISMRSVNETIFTNQHSWISWEMQKRGWEGNYRNSIFKSDLVYRSSCSSVFLILFLGLQLWELNSRRNRSHIISRDFPEMLKTAVFYRADLSLWVCGKVTTTLSLFDMIKNGKHLNK